MEEKPRDATGVDLSESYAPHLRAAVITTFTVASISVILRFTARRLKKLNWWIDDWFVLVALV